MAIYYGTQFTEGEMHIRVNEMRYNAAFFKRFARRFHNEV